MIVILSDYLVFVVDTYHSFTILQLYLYDLSTASFSWSTISTRMGWKVFEVLIEIQVFWQRNDSVPNISLLGAAYTSPNFLTHSKYLNLSSSFKQAFFWTMMSSLQPNLFRSNLFFKFGNRKQAVGAKYREYGEWGSDS